MEVEDIQRQFTKFRRIGNNGGRRSSDSSSKIIDIGGNKKGEVKLDQLEAGVHLADEEEQEARPGGGRVVVKRSGGMTMDMVVGGGGRLCGWPSSRIVRVSRASGGKDRHSKVLTSKGLRDRRVRLSVSTAIQFYDLQDRLGYEQPSKAVEWLLKAASSSINELPSLDASFSNKNDKSGDAELDLDLDDLTTNYSHCHQQQQNRKCSSTSETSKGSGGLSLSRSEIRIKARERARERAAVDKEKGKENNIIVNDESTRGVAAAAATATATATADNNNNNNDADYNNKDDDVMNQSHHRRHVNLGISRNASSFTDLLTGGISISRRVSNNNNNNGTTTPEINSPRDYEFFTVPTSSSGPVAETSQQQIRPMAGRVSVPPQYQHQQNHGHHHPELHHFSFLQENFFHPVVTAGETNYNLNFSISSSAVLAGFNRGTLQSNLVPSSLLPHIHQRLIPSIVDGASNLPFLVGATTASAAVSSNDSDNPFRDSYDARLQLCYGDSVTAAAAAADHHKGKGKS